MKFLKSYKLFESISNINDIKSDIKDILIDLIDLNYEVSISDRQSESFLHKNMVNQEILIYIEKPDIEDITEYSFIPSIEFIEPLERLINYSIDNLFSHSIYTYKDSVLLDIYNFSDIKNIVNINIDYIKIILQRKV